MRLSLLILTALAGIDFSARLLLAEEFHGKPYEGGDVFADTWVATDGAGRALPDEKTCGPVRKDKFVGLFYWTWHHAGRPGPYDNTKAINAAKDGKVDWGDVATAERPGMPHHWGEPEMGYYLATDPFVIRKHASMLSDAGVDVVLFDTTNPPLTFKEQYEALCREFTAMRKEGARTPAIAFITPFGDPRAITDQLWRDLYQPKKWQDLWFVWEGKPLILADPAFIKDPEQKAFYTYRKPMPDYFAGPSGPDQWSWLEVFPQHAFKNAKGETEQVSVGVSHNAIAGTLGPAPMSHKAGAMGRSWHDGHKDEREGAINLGLNFDEQWKRAIELDPKFVFVTGWNEWVAGRFITWSHFTDADSYFAGGMFVDEYSHEYSRDIEPMLGGHTDNYYYQLASWVRRYKGIRPRPTAAGPVAIAIDGAFDDWAAAGPEFRDTIGDTIHRDHPGYGSLIYKNATGRNDFVLTKAAYDEKTISFFVQTRQKITPRTDRNWMLLFIDADQNVKTGWCGYDYAINLEVPSDTQTTVKAWQNGAWVRVGDATYRVNGNGMELSVPRSLIAQSDHSPAFDFHWSDNAQRLDDVSAFAVDGDSAPNRRANYQFGAVK